VAGFPLATYHLIPINEGQTTMTNLRPINDLLITILIAMILIALLSARANAASDCRDIEWTSTDDPITVVSIGAPDLDLWSLQTEKDVAYRTIELVNLGTDPADDLQVTLIIPTDPVYGDQGYVVDCDDLSVTLTPVGPPTPDPANYAPPADLATGCAYGNSSRARLAPTFFAIAFLPFLGYRRR